MTGVARVGAAGGDLAASVIGLVRSDPQFIAIVVLATAEIQIVAVCVATHGQPGLSFAGGSGKGFCLQRKHEIGLLLRRESHESTPVGGTTKYRSVSRTSYDNSAVAKDYIVYSKDSSGILNRTEGPHCPGSFRSGCLRHPAPQHLTQIDQGDT